jgi:prophage antirepressor-like protein
MKSKLKTAEQFQDHVYDIVLPPIRRAGQEKVIEDALVINIISTNWIIGDINTNIQ